MKDMSISASELERLAGEILEKLRETAKTATAGCGEDGEAGGKRRSESLAEWAKDIQKRAELESAAARESLRARDALESALYREPSAENAERLPILSRQELREAGNVSLSRAPRRAGAGNSGSGAPLFLKGEGTDSQAETRMTAESLSEAFCRDARRYDGGFEKY